MKPDRLTETFVSLSEKLHGYAMSMLHSDDDARDAMHDAYLRLYTREQMRDSREAANKLTTVLRNICIDRLRQRMRHPSAPFDDVGERDYGSCITDDGDVRRLEKEFDRVMTQGQKSIYRAIVHEGKSYEDVAAEMDVSVESVRMTMSRIRSRIRNRYKQLNP